MIAPARERDLHREVGELLVRYAKRIDRKGRARFRTGFTDDCQADCRGGSRIARRRYTMVHVSPIHRG